MTHCDIFLIFAQNINRGNTLEPPQCAFDCYTLTVKNMHKDFISRLKWTARAQKTGFSSLSCSDKTTNDKFDGHTLK